MSKKMILPLTLAVAISFTGVAQTTDQTSDQPLPRAEDEIQQEAQQTGEDIQREGQQAGEEVQQTQEQAEQQAQQQSEQAQQQSEQAQQQAQQAEDQAKQQEQAAEEAKKQQQSAEEQQKQVKMVGDLEKSLVLNRIHHVNQKEIELAKLAQKQAQSQQIKDMAQMILNDHEQNDQQLQSLAKSEGVKLSGYKPAGYEQAAMDQLKQLKGAQFDQAFGDLLHQSHAMTAQDLQLISQDIQDPQVKQFVAQLIPKIQQHEQQSQRFSS